MPKLFRGTHAGWAAGPDLLITEEEPRGSIYSINTSCIESLMHREKNWEEEEKELFAVV